MSPHRFTLRVLTALLVSLSLANALLAKAPRKREWAQVRAEITYKRSGTLATAKEGHFDFEFVATLDQLMLRGAPGQGQNYPSYSLPSDYERSFLLDGKVTLNGSADQVDETSGKKYHSSVGLSGKLGSKEDLQLVEVGAAFPWDTKLGAKLEVGALLKGSVTSDFPLMDGMRVENYVTLWPAPVSFDDEKGFVCQGEYWLRPVLGEKPQESFYEPVYMVAKAAEEMEKVPNQNGFLPPGVGVVTQGGASDWKLVQEKSSDLDTLTGGHYSESIRVVIYEVKKTLPEPAKKPEEE